MTNLESKMIHDALRYKAQQCIVALDETGDNFQLLTSATGGLITALQDAGKVCECCFCALCEDAYRIVGDVWRSLRAGTEASDEQQEQLRNALQPYLPKVAATSPPA